MRYLYVLALVPVVLTGATLSTPAAAAKAGAVMQACDNVASAGGSCSYKIDPNGNVYGCAQAKGSSKQSCFTCPGGGGDCSSALKSGKPGKGPVTVGGIKLPPTPLQGGPKGKGGLTPVSVGGSKQTGSSNQPVTIERTNNTQHSGSGGGGGGKK